MGKNIKKFLHSKMFILLLVIMLILSVGIIGTYAWFTWSSQDNTTLTMKIGEIADITFTNGNDINTSLTPVFNYYDGEKTTFSVKNMSLDPNVIVHSITLNIESLPNELKNESLKYKLVGDNNYVIEGDFSEVSETSSIVLAEDIGLNSGETNYTFYLYIDGNIENNSNMIDKIFKGNISATAEALESTPLSDFTYSIGTFDFNDTTITIPEGNVLLSDYIGTDSIVKVPSTYVIDGTEYTSMVYGTDLIDTNVYERVSGTFSNDTNITEVYFGNNVTFGIIETSSDPTKFKLNNARFLFSRCSSLTKVEGLTNITNMGYTFEYCASLKIGPIIPNTVKELVATFDNCTSLESTSLIPIGVETLQSTFSGCSSLANVPVIPNTVTNMQGTFTNCSSLKKVPIIPNGVTNLTGTFFNCTSLTEAPAIPSSVTTMTMTFQKCTNLTGTIDILSSDCCNSFSIEYDTSLKNVLFKLMNLFKT